MARYGARVRTVVFLDADTIAKCNDLGARYRASRSEVLRISVELGLKEVRPALRRLQRVRAADYKPARGGGSTPSAPAASSAPVLPGSPYQQLLAYGNSFLAMSEDNSPAALRAALGAHAQVLGFPDEDVAATIEQVLEAVLGDDALGDGADGDASPLPPD